MNDDTTPSEYLALSRGKWDEDLPPARIQAAIDAFYAWHESHIDTIGIRDDWST